ncbi:hypothetical protein [Mycolicibacterium llatzerense]|nr:hypothetical protein [Mycolicibacterium llatzerense]
MWRQDLERQADDDIGHHDDVDQRNIHDHSHSDVKRADGGHVGAGH